MANPKDGDDKNDLTYKSVNNHPKWSKNNRIRRDQRSEITLCTNPNFTGTGIDPGEWRIYHLQYLTRGDGLCNHPPML